MRKITATMLLLLFVMFSLTGCTTMESSSSGMNSSLQFTNETVYFTSENTGLGFVISTFPFSNTKVTDSRPLSVNASYIPLKDPVFNWDGQNLDEQKTVGEINADGSFTMEIPKPSAQILTALPPGLSSSVNGVLYTTVQIWGDLNKDVFNGFDTQFRINIDLEKPTMVNKSLPLEQRVSNIKLGMLIYFNKACTIDGTSGKFTFNKVVMQKGWNIIGFTDKDAANSGWFTPKEVKIFPIETKMYLLHFYWG